MKMQKPVVRRQIQIGTWWFPLVQYLLGISIGVIPLLMALFFLNGGFISGDVYIVGANTATCVLALMLYIGDFLCASFLLRHRTLRYAGSAIIVMLIVIPIFLLFFFAVIHTPTPYYCSMCR
jgi:hypothetical protein